VKQLEERILKDGTVFGEDILKVDTFLNHQIDVALMNEIGKVFYDKFKDKPVTKVLTIEASGIAIGMAVAAQFGVPLVFAKKVESRNLDLKTYETQVYSFTKEKNYTVRVSKKFLSETDQVLIVDDFLAMGRAALGLIDLVEQANGQVVGVGIVIEKVFQEGGKLLRDRGIQLESLARIESFSNNLPIFVKVDE
jgi:xanthine phosphoribosyltransferase